MTFKIIFHVLIFNILFLNMGTAFGQVIAFDPNEKELNLPFKYNNGKFYLHLDALNFNKPTGPVREIAKCEVDISTKIGSKNVQVFVYKSSNKKFGKVITSYNGISTTSNYPYVVTETVTKDSLGQYATALEVAQLLGLTQVDSAKIIVVDPDLTQIKNLIFFYDEDGELIDQTIFINNQWMRCK
jgi:hypothetical protein